MRPSLLVLALLLGAGSQDSSLAEARRLLAEGTLEEGLLAVHAKVLLDSGDTNSLAGLLETGKPGTVKAILNALRVGGSDLLMVEVLDLAVGSDDASIAALARDSLAELAARQGDVQERMIGWLEGGGRGVGQRVLIEVLGGCENVAAVTPIIRELDGPHADVANQALIKLTGYRPRGTDLASEWREFWERNGSFAREQLIDRALGVERTRNDEILASKDRRIEDLLKELMGQDVERLKEALGGEYQGVRLEAARRLGELGPERAAGAVPSLLRQLGHHVDVGTNGKDQPSETDPAVRAEMVTALGKLGRDQDEVRTALAQELRSENGAVAAAALGAISYVRGKPAIVAPLLDLIEHGGQDEALCVDALTAVAQNRPRGVLPRLARWLEPGQPVRVRAAALSAVLACDELGAALDHLDRLPLADQDAQLRYTAAAGLGDAAGGLAEEAPERARVLRHLGELMHDAEPSVRAAAATSLGKTGMQAALTILAEGAPFETTPSVIVRILGAIGDLGFAEGVPLIGSICARAPLEGAEGPALLEGAQQSLSALGQEADAAGWLAMGDRLRESGAMLLAARIYADTARRFAAASESRTLVEQARGLQAESLSDAGQALAARELLEELHRQDAPFPPRSQRLDLLAQACVALDDHAAAADYLLERLAGMPPGESDVFPTKREAVRELRTAGRPAEALPLVEQLLEADPSSNEILHERMLVLTALGRWEDAVETGRRLRERIPAEDVHFLGEVDDLLRTLAAQLGQEAEPDSSTG